MRWTVWAAITVLAGFAVLDLCGIGQPVPLPPAEAIEAVAAGVEVVPFETLAAGDRPWPVSGEPFTAPSADERVRALDGRRIAVAGYMLPTELDGARARRFLLSRWAGGCCFGGTIEPDDLIDCEVAAADGVEPVSHVPVLVVGTFRVRTPSTAGELAAGLYALDACEVRDLTE